MGRQLDDEPPSKREKKGHGDSRSVRLGETGGNQNVTLHTQVPPACSTPKDRRICINVGATCISTLESTLRSEESLLSEWVENDFWDLPRDAKGNPFLDRDPESFRHIINFLRGYELPLATEKIAFLAEDAEFYRIKNLRALIDPPAQWRFVSGPGVSQDNTLFSTENILGMCGTEPLPMRGRSTFVLHVDKCELVSIGLIGTDSPLQNQPLKGQPYSIAYCNTGELVQCLDSEPTFISGPGFKSHDDITVQVIFTPGPTAMIIFFCGEVKVYEVEWPAPVPPMRFAVSLHGTSAVTLRRCITGEMSGEAEKKETVTEDRVI